MKCSIRENKDRGCKSVANKERIVNSKITNWRSYGCDWEKNMKKRTKLRRVFFQNFSRRMFIFELKPNQKIPGSSRDSEPVYL